MAERSTRDTRGNQRALIGAGVLAAAGAAAFLLTRRSSDGEDALVVETVTIDRPRQELYAEWRDFTKFPRFMDNVEEVEDLGGGRSRWTIKAPAGASVELVTRITEDRAGQTIAWQSEPESQIETEGRVEFEDAGAGSGTTVRLSMRYDPPGGLPGRIIAKIFQREPGLQAERDLRRFKELMEDEAAVA